MLVTRHFSPENRNFATADTPDRADLDGLFPLPPVEPFTIKKPSTWYPAPPTKFQSVGFCDWISIYQRHPQRLPVLCDGAFVRIDVNGETVNTTLRKTRIEGTRPHSRSSATAAVDGQVLAWMRGR